MQNLQIGGLFSLKNHPHSIISEALIGADANFTPPIMVICEILNSNKEYNTEDGIQEVNQVRGVFYSSNSHKFEKHWFKVEEITFIEVIEIEGSKLEKEASDKQKLKSDLRNNLVILNSVENELSKRKISEEIRNLESLYYKQNPLLSSLPPVMTVIDVRETEILKSNFDKQTGRKKRIISQFELKCKHFNPLTTTFSEEWLPLECLYDVTNNFVKQLDKISTTDYYLINLDAVIKFEDNNIQQKNTLIKIKKIVFYHYRYLIVAENILTKELIKLTLPKLSGSKNFKDNQLVESKVRPDFSKHPHFSEDIFIVGKLYKITYFSEAAKKSQRVILVKAKIETSNNGDFIIVANCFLRKGQIRNFKLKNIQEVRKVRDNIKKYLSS